MKNKIYLFSILILFQSCFSYKTFEINNYEEVKPKKVKIELRDSRIVKGEIIEFKADKIVLKKINETVEVSVTNIEEIKGRKFSYLKTFILSSAISVTVLVTLFYQVIEGIGEVSISGR